jgi:hypothetical protein
MRGLRVSPLRASEGRRGGVGISAASGSEGQGRHISEQTKSMITHK